MAPLKAWHLLAGTHLAAGIVGFALAPRELLETEVAHSGFFQVDTKRVLSAAVDSLRTEHSMVALRFKSSATVSVERDGFLMLDGHQLLTVPAAVSLMVDLSQLSADSVTYDEAAKLVHVVLPPLTMSDVAFDVEGARAINGGLLTFSAAQVDELTKLNYAAARRAIVKQAQGTALVAIAMRQAISNVTNYFSVPLHATGQGDVRVEVKFAP